MLSKRRVLKETRQLETNKIPGITIITTDNMCELFADITVPNNQLYAGKSYRLKIIVNENYPFVAPVAYFVKDINEGITEIPIHPHIYSNGHICLDLLGPAWTPVHSISSLLLSIQSILTSNTTDERPEDDQRYVKRAPKDPSKTTFVYHDETV